MEGSVKLRNSLAHVLLHPLYAEARPLRDLRITETVEPVGHEDLARLRLQSQHRPVEPVQQVALLEYMLLILPLHPLFVQRLMGVCAVAPLRPCAS